MAFVFAAFPVNGYPTGSFPLLGFPGYTPEEAAPARQYGGKWFKGKKELAALEGRILREDEEFIELISIIMQTELFK
jgi:hypothetical protein